MAGPIQAVGVVGGGLMGSGIAQTAAQAGIPTIVRELSEDLCERSRRSIVRMLDKGVERGKVTPDARQATIAHLSFTTDLGALGDSDLIIEAVVENLEAKNALWHQLDALCGERTIF